MRYLGFSWDTAVAENTIPHIPDRMTEQYA